MNLVEKLRRRETRKVLLTTGQLLRLDPPDVVQVRPPPDSGEGHEPPILEDANELVVVDDSVEIVTEPQELNVFG